MTDKVNFCPHCGLVYRPDERIYEDAASVCPKCGKKLIIKDKEK